MDVELRDQKLKILIGDDHAAADEAWEELLSADGEVVKKLCVQWLEYLIEDAPGGWYDEELAGHLVSLLHDAGYRRVP